MFIAEHWIGFEWNTFVCLPAIILLYSIAMLMKFDCSSYPRNSVPICMGMWMSTFLSMEGFGISFGY